MKKLKLSPKQTAFVTEYIKDFNGTQAAKRAGYSPNAAKEQAARLLTNDNIQEAIKDHQRKARDKANITLEWWLKEVKDLTQNAKRDSDKARGLDMLGKHLGAYTSKIELLQTMEESKLDIIIANLLKKIDDE